MVQHDMNVADGSGAVVRSDLNGALEALSTLQLGATAPSPTWPLMLWGDSANDLLKQRNKANTAWISHGSLESALLRVTDIAAGGSAGLLRADGDGGSLSNIQSSSIDSEGSAEGAALLSDGSGGVTWGTVSGGFGDALLHVQDQKASGLDGGTFTSGAWRTRDLNTVLTNEIAGASVSGNQMTLPSGDYFILASAPAYTVGSHRAKMFNVTDASDILIGTSEAMSTASNVQTRSFLAGRFTLASEKIVELRHRGASTSSGTGFGVASSFSDPEIYADVSIWKV